MRTHFTFLFSLQPAKSQTLAYNQLYIILIPVLKLSIKMSHKLVISLGFILFINIFYSCNCSTYSLNFPGQTSSKIKYSPIRGSLMERTFGKRSADQEGELNGEYYDYSWDEPDELQCAEDQFWHIRGFRCVPFECPGGNRFRDKHTGECTLKSYGVSKGDTMNGHQQGRVLNRLKSPTKFRLPFGLTLKG